MKQVFNDLRTGQIRVVDAPAPFASHNGLLIQTKASLISAGTERMLVEFGQASLLGKARAQPEKVRQVLDKIRADGLLPTLDSVFTRLDEPLPLGYCNAGVVLEVGRGVSGFSVGDRVSSNGGHAELVAVSHTLCAKIPEQVAYEEAAFAPLASVALQGIRLASPTLGERFVVIGLGLVGLLTVQILRANGCGVLALDPHVGRLALAQQFGASIVDVSAGVDPVTAAMDWAKGRGVDGVLIAASSKSDELVHQAASMCRKRGRIVLLGVVGLNLRRADFYEKELTFQVSCSYGPGRYDEMYENRGQDYPLGFVRWTEQRNFDAVLEMLESKRLDVSRLISHRFAVEEAASAYDAVTQQADALGIVLQYSETVERAARVVTAPVVIKPGRACLAVVGAGNFSKMTLMPALAKAGARVKYVCDIGAGAAANLARKHGAEQAITDYRLALDDREVTGIVLAVGHQLHAQLVVESLAAGKHVLVEKPLALTFEEIRRLKETVALHRDRMVMVGFNRRFSAYAVRMREALRGRAEPLAMNTVVNAGSIPPSHWVHDKERGGGRIIGEACHFIDLMVYLTGSRVVSVSANMMGAGPATQEDKMVISLSFADGSIGTLAYFANGSRSYPKERVEVFSEGRVLRLENFRRLEGWGFRGFSPLFTFRHDKGHTQELQAFVRAIESGGAPVIAWDDLTNVTLASLACVVAAQEKRTIHLEEEFLD